MYIIRTPVLVVIIIIQWIIESHRPCIPTPHYYTEHPSVPKCMLYLRCPLYIGITVEMSRQWARAPEANSSGKHEHR